MQILGAGRLGPYSPSTSLLGDPWGASSPQEAPRTRVQVPCLPTASLTHGCTPGRPAMRPAQACVLYLEPSIPPSIPITKDTGLRP